MEPAKTNAHTNPAFVPDLNSSNPKLHELEAGKKAIEAEGVYDPYLERNIRRPITSLYKMKSRGPNMASLIKPYDQSQENLTSSSHSKYTYTHLLNITTNLTSLALEAFDRTRKVIYNVYNVNSETLFHLLKGSLGTGILAMPNAFYHAGYVLGLIGTIVIGIICTYCVHSLIKAEYELCKRIKKPSLTYPGTAEAALAEGPSIMKKISPYAPHIVNTFLLTYQLGTCCVYIVFISENVKSVVDAYDTELHLEIYMLIILLPLILLNYIRNLKYLAPFSTGANFITLISFGFILYYIIHDGPTFENRDPVGEVRYWPLFFGTVLFALEAIGVIMPLENEMKTPKAFGGTIGVLNIAMSIIVTLYVGMGLLGYLTYGSEAKGSITLNIGEEEVPAQVIKILYALAIFITYGLQCYVAIDIAWNEYLSKRFDKNNKKLFFEYFTRTVIVLITFLLAVAVPKLELFISLFGALCLSALGIAFPAIIDMCTYWNKPRGGLFVLFVCKNGFLIIFGFTGLIIGTYTSISEIVKAFG